MGILRRWVTLALPTIVLAVACVPAIAQTADADEATALLTKGQAQHAAFEYKQAKATLLQIDPDKLSAEQRKAYDSLLNGIDDDIRQQAADMEAFNQAQKAMADGDLAAAKTGFAQAAASEHLPQPTVTDAKALLARVNKALADNGAESTPDTPEESADTPETTPDEGADAISKLQAQRTAQAKDLLVKGKTALDKNDFEQAAGYFERALSLDPDLDEAMRLLKYTRRQIGTASEVSAMSRLIISRKIALQIANVEFAKAMRAARTALAGADSEEDFNEATEAANAAENILETNKTYFSDEQYRSKTQEIANLRKFIRDQKETWNTRMVDIRRQEIEAERRKRRVREQEQRQAKLDSLRSRARTLISEHKYAPAVDVLREIQRLEPTDQWADERLELITQLASMQQEKRYVELRQQEEVKQWVDLRESEIPWYTLIHYPEDWKELSLRRTSIGAETTGETEEERKIRQQLRQKIQRLNFDGVEFKDVIAFLRDVSGVNIHVKWNALQQSGIDRTTPVTVKLNDVSLEKALRVILETVGGITPLTYVIDEGVIEISTRDDLSRKTTIKVYDIRDMIFRVPNFSGPRIDLNNTTGNQGSNNNNNGGGLLANNDDNDDDDNGEDNVPTRSEIIQRITTVIRNSVDRLSWQPEGETGSIEELHGQLVITQTPENHAKIQDLISQLREQRSLQIAIEARFLSVNAGFLSQIGMDVDIYFNIGSRLGSTTTTDPWTGATVPQSLPGNTSAWGSGKPGTNELTPIAVQNGTFDFGNVLGLTTPVSNSIGNAVGAVPALSIGGTLLDDIQVDFLLQATQAHATTRMLTAPRITIFNGQRSYVTVGTQQAYIAEVRPIVSSNSTADQPVIGYVPTGTVLDVEATVSADRRYVIMTVRPQISTLNSLTSVAVGGTTIQLPNVTVQDLQTTVSVPDGGTLLLGGQKQSGEVEREMGVPIISRIPILNRLSTNRGKIRDEQTLLILIRPKIIIQQEEEEKQFPPGGGDIQPPKYGLGY